MGPEHGFDIVGRCGARFSGGWGRRSRGRHARKGRSKRGHSTLPHGANRSGKSRL